LHQPAVKRQAEEKVRFSNETMDASKPRSVNSHSSSAAPNNNFPRRLPGYTFNNGNAKQPILRARECDTRNESSSVDLNFNYWMEHSYAVDRQLSGVVNHVLRKSGSNAISSDATESEAIVKAQSLDAINNILVVSVQGADPLELNDCIMDLPFLRSASSMPVRHIREAGPALVSLEDTAGGQAASEQQWQYMDVDSQNSLMLWCEKPSEALQEVAGRGLPDLLARFILTFQVRRSRRTFLQFCKKGVSNLFLICIPPALLSALCLLTYSTLLIICSSLLVCCAGTGLLATGRAYAVAGRCGDVHRPAQWQQQQ
jgi:hypothetical protein